MRGHIGQIGKRLSEEAGKVSVAVKFDSTPLAMGTLELAVVEIDVKDQYRINLRFKHLSLNLLKEISLFMQTNILDMLNKMPEADLQVKATESKFTGHDGVFVNNWDVAIFPLSNGRAKLVSGIIKDKIISKFNK